MLKLKLKEESLEKKLFWNSGKQLKQRSDLFMPVSGGNRSKMLIWLPPNRWTRIPYQGGWMVKVEMTDPSQVNQLMNAADYMKLIGCWCLIIPITCFFEIICPPLWAILFNHLWNTGRQDSGTHLLQWLKPDKIVHLLILHSLLLMIRSFKLQQSSSYLQESCGNTGFATLSIPMESHWNFAGYSFIYTEAETWEMQLPIPSEHLSDCGRL